MEELRIPNHVGIILDGNRRWAKEHLIMVNSLFWIQEYGAKIMGMHF